MSDYTPTTEQVRTEWVESGSDSPTNHLHAGAAFDRWLAARDAEVEARAERLAAALALVLYDAHPTFSSTAKWGGGIGGQAVTPHCSITQGPPPGDDWSQWDLPSKPLREFLDRHPFDLTGAKAALKAELLADLAGDGAA